MSEKYTFGCPVCYSDAGNLGFDTAEEALEWVAEEIECNACGNEVEPIAIKQ